MNVQPSISQDIADLYTKQAQNTDPVSGSISTGAAGSAAATNTATATSGSSSAKVSLSAQAQTYVKALADVQQPLAPRMDRVAAAKAKYLSGSYNFSADNAALADKLLNNS